MPIPAACKAAIHIVAFVALCAASVAFAHPAPFSYLDITLDAERVQGALVIHDFDAAYELGIEKPARLLDSKMAQTHRESLLALIERRLQFGSDAQRLAIVWGDIEVLSERQSLRLPFQLQGRAEGVLRVDAALFPYDVNPQTFVNVYEAGALRQQVILDARLTSMQFYPGTLQGRWAVVKTFVKAGVHHILIGPDHILFLVGLLLLGGGMWRLAAIVTAFTIGHSVTLSLAALGIVSISPVIVEPAIALSIVVVGVDNLLVRRQRQSGEFAGRDLRPWLAATFGLIHGFGFAAVLAEVGLPREALGWSLAAFNVGVEVGQLSIVTVVLAIGHVLRRTASTAPVLRERFLTLGSVAVIVAGVYWLVQRLTFTAAA